jgi:hypothetical protein
MAVLATVTFEDEIKFTGIMVEDRLSQSSGWRYTRNKHRCRAGNPSDVLLTPHGQRDEAKIGCKMGAKPLVL